MAPPTTEKQARNVHWPPPSLPTKPETRIPESKIKVLPVEPDDLEEWAAVGHSAFPLSLWAELEDDAPPLELRIKRLAKWHSAWLKVPGLHYLKAVSAETGETMGVAIWHNSTPSNGATFPTTYPTIPDETFPSYFLPGCWRHDLVDDFPHTTFASWARSDIDESVASRKQRWKDHFRDGDRLRLVELRETPHWFLSPIAVRKEWQGRGVGAELMLWGLRKADMMSAPCILYAAPNAVPVYERYGFRSTKEHGPGKNSQMVRPAQSSNNESGGGEQ